MTPEENKASEKTRQEAHSAKLKVYHKTYQEVHKEEIKAKKKLYREKNRQEIMPKFALGDWHIQNKPKKQLKNGTRNIQTE